MQIYIHDDGRGNHGYLVSPAMPIELSPWACEAADFADISTCENVMASLGIEGGTEEHVGRITGYAVDVL